MRISDWSSDVCSSDLLRIAQEAAVIDGGMTVRVQHDIIAPARQGGNHAQIGLIAGGEDHRAAGAVEVLERFLDFLVPLIGAVQQAAAGGARAEIVQRLLARGDDVRVAGHRSEEHTSELQSLMRSSYAV